ncbi:hypothetical protein JTE90_005222 [Oedothorax gibbosus]|uniref:Uncharacterized protein n=1 Tax=Oedothorax gibbosus TaxID=931172 RepID=A0AAV6UK71_9ARAC|nr:hypothetical protein JTE90_005222 [Oedothorax gibbosus]
MLALTEVKQYLDGDKVNKLTKRIWFLESGLGDKQVLSTDINGNPFASRSSRSSNLASFVSSTLMDYSSGGGANDATKNKWTRRNNKGVLSENIAGHRGRDDIDSLLQFINSSDKKAKGGQVDQKKALVKSKSGCICSFAPPPVRVISPIDAKGE